MKKIILSSRMQGIAPSDTAEISKRVEELKKNGNDIISLGIGQPDFPTPSNIIDVAKKALDENIGRYTDVNGIPELQKAIQSKFKRENDLIYTKDQIFVSCGGKSIFFHIMMATLDISDEVIVPSPYWVSYPNIICLFNGKPIIVNCPIEYGFKLTAEKLERVITPKTKWLILNSPSNPTGVSYTYNELKALSEVLLKNEHVYIFSDDIYEHYMYEGAEFYTIAQVAPELKNRVVTMNGVSKSHSMAGWRLGYAGGPDSIIKAATIIQSQSILHPASISQVAAVEALNGGKKYIEKNREIFCERKNIVVGMINNIEGLYCINPSGAFYVFVNCSKMIGKVADNNKVIKTDKDFVLFLLNTVGVSVIHGAPFGLSPYFRLSYAIDKNVLIDACSKIKSACNSLR